MSTATVDFEQDATMPATRQDHSSRPAAEDLWALPVSSRVPHQSPQFWTGTAQGVVTVHGEVDIANHHMFAMVVDAVAHHVGDGDASRGEAHLDLADLDFIDVGGARVLVTAAAKRGPGDQLVIHHPPPILVRILQVGWGQLPGLRLEQSLEMLTECSS